MTIQEIKKNIPHGGLIIIAERTGITKQTICNFFAGKRKASRKTGMKILDETAKYLKELKEKEAETLKQFEEIIN